MEISNLKNLRRAEVKEKCQLQVSNRYAALGVLDDSRDLNSAGGNIRENIMVSAKTF
jgi:hypothetical protein